MSNHGISATIAIGNFDGAELRYWAGEPGTAELGDLNMSDAVELRTHDCLTFFDANCAHEVLALKDGATRFSLVWYTVDAWQQADPEDVLVCKRLGFPMQTAELLKAAKDGVKPKGFKRLPLDESHGCTATRSL